MSEKLLELLGQAAAAVAAVAVACISEAMDLIYLFVPSRSVAVTVALLSCFDRLLSSGDFCGHPPHPAAGWQRYRGDGGLLQARKESPAEAKGNNAPS